MSSGQVRPARILACVSVSRRRISSSCWTTWASLACGIADDHVAGLDGNAAGNNGKSDLAGAALAAAVGGDAARMQREADRENAIKIAGHAIDDDGTHAGALRHHGDVVTDNGRAREGFSRHDDDVTGFDQGEGGEDCQIVVGQCLDGKGDAGELRACGIERLDGAIKSATAEHSVDDLASLGADELVDEREVGSWERAADGEQWRLFQHGSPFSRGARQAAQNPPRGLPTGRA
jgi:hypothetical protein